MNKPVTLYHATMAESVPSILAKGLYPQMHTQWVGAAGQQLSEIGKVYAFTDRRDAIRLAFKLEWDTKRPAAVVTFASKKSDWVIDTHWESFGAFGWWLKSKGSWIKIPPEDILATEELTTEMTKSVVAAGLPGKKKPWGKNPSRITLAAVNALLEPLGFRLERVSFTLTKRDTGWNSAYDIIELGERVRLDAHKSVAVGRLSDIPLEQWPQEVLDRLEPMSYKSIKIGVYDKPKHEIDPATGRVVLNPLRRPQ